MAAAGSTNALLDEGQTLFEKGHESWKSYFSRWEVFAKYEEYLPESELFSEAKEKAKSSRQKKVKRQSHQIKSTVLPSLKYKKNQRNRKKIIKRKRALSESKQEVNIIEPHHDTNNENLVEDSDVQLETILKTVFTKVLKANKNEFQMFAVLSQTYSHGEVRNPSNFFHLDALDCYSSPKSLTPLSEHTTNIQTISLYGGTSTRKLIEDSSLFKFSTNFRESEEIRNSVFKDGFPKFKINYQSNLNEQFFLPVNRNQTPRRTNSCIKTSYPAFLSSSSSENPKLMSFEWDLSLKSQNSICGKINREHFIKRSFHKMNMMEQDGKRFRDLCLRKRTNSVTLSMENSNFITPERNPLERKCFSENILQRKRRRPSKLFFGDDEEDSDSDDQTEKHTPIIHCKRKGPKTISKIVESDSDDCESIFDMVSLSKFKMQN